MSNSVVSETEIVSAYTEVGGLLEPEGDGMGETITEKQDAVGTMNGRDDYVRKSSADDGIILNHHSDQHQEAAFRCMMKARRNIAWLEFEDLVRHMKDESKKDRRKWMPVLNRLHIVFNSEEAYADWLSTMVGKKHTLETVKRFFVEDKDVDKMRQNKSMRRYIFALQEVFRIIYETELALK